MDPYMQHRLSSQGDMFSFTGMLTDTSNVTKKPRGPTQMRDIWGNRGDKIVVDCNRFGQPTGKNASKLANFIGTLVRDGKNAPLHFKNWRKVPDNVKDGLWDIIQEKFEIPANAKDWVMKTCGRKRSTWKASLKKSHYLKDLSFEEQNKFKDKRVYNDQWEELLHYWDTDEFKKMSATNKNSRAKKKHNHNTGTQSFAQVRELQKKELGRSPTRAESFRLCFSKKSGTTNNATRDIMLQLQEKESLNQDPLKEANENDIFSEVMGKDKVGQVRMYGLGVSPSAVWGEKSNDKTDQVEDIAGMKMTINNLKAQVETLTSALASRQNNDNAITLQNQLARPISDQTRQQWTSSSSSTYDTLPSIVGDVVHLKSIYEPSKTIAIGTLNSKDPLKKVGGEELGSYFSEIIVQVPISPEEKLLKPYGQFKTIGQVVGAPIAWPRAFVLSPQEDI